LLFFFHNNAELFSPWGKLFIVLRILRAAQAAP
jgi:hypothetical protein